MRTLVMPCSSPAASINLSGPRLGLVYRPVVPFGSWKRALAAAAVVAAVAPGAGCKRRKVPATLTEAQRAAPVLVEHGGERRLRHPTFGFSLRHPGPSFREAPELVAAYLAAGPDPETQHYGLMDEETRSALTISVMNGMGGSRESLSQHVDDFQRGFAGSPAGSANLRWLGKEITWDDRRHRATVRAEAAGLQIEVVAHSVQPAQGPPFIVNLTAMGTQIDGLRKTLASFQP
jgi:hypothetical protein